MAIIKKSNLIRATAEYTEFVRGFRLSGWKKFMTLLKKYNYDLPRKYI